MKFSAFEPIDLKNNSQSFGAIDLSLSQVVPDKNQPRKTFTDNSLEELALSIKKHGVIQPIIVRSIDNGNKFEIIAGERRWRASKLAGLDKIPAIIKEYDKPSRMAISLIENIQRENLNPLEEAQAIQSLLLECHMTHSQVAESLGKSRTTVTNLLRLLSLATRVKNMICSGMLEMGHARSLLSLSEDQQIKVAERIINKSLSVREAEKLVQNLNISHAKSVTPKSKKSQQLEMKAKEWSALLSNKFSSKVTVDFNSNGDGKVVIHFETSEEGDWLMHKLHKSDVEKV